MHDEGWKHCPGKQPSSWIDQPCHDRVDHPSNPLRLRIANPERSRWLQPPHGQFPSFLGALGEYILNRVPTFKVSIARMQYVSVWFNVLLTG